MKEGNKETLDFCAEETVYLQQLVLVRLQVTDTNANWHEKERLYRFTSLRSRGSSSFRLMCSVDNMNLFVSTSALCFPLC